MHVIFEQGCGYFGFNIKAKGDMHNAVTKTKYSPLSIPPNRNMPAFELQC